MKYLISLFLLLFLLSFKTQNGISLKIENMEKENFIVVFFSVKSCNKCFETLGAFLAKQINAKEFTYFLVSENKNNNFERQMVAESMAKILDTTLKWHYIFDETENPFLKKYHLIYSPELLIYYHKKYKHIPYKDIFEGLEVSANLKLID
jgi:hypothetical protein